jgi:tripartite-type tricarboxylate transporter receptor subunit TctC
MSRGTPPIPPRQETLPAMTDRIALPRRVLPLAAAGLLAAPGMAHAAWPERPVQIVVPFPPGGGVDLTARVAARFLEKHTGGRSFVVVNRPGAGGEVGWASVGDAAPDGHTLALLNAPNIMAIPIERRSRFTMESFAFIAALVDDPVTISVHAQSPYRTMAGLVAAMRAQPGRMTYGTAGIGAVGHIAFLTLARALGVSAEHVPFQGAANVATAVLGRQVEIATTTFAESRRFVAAGDWRGLGVMSPRRLAAMPDLPTMREQGIAAEMGSIRGLGAPRATPPAVLAAIAEAVAKVVQDPEYLAALDAASLPPRYLAQAGYLELLANMDRDLKALWQTNPWRQS